MTLVVQASKPVMMETSMHIDVVGSRQMAPIDYGKSSATLPNPESSSNLGIMLQNNYQPWMVIRQSRFRLRERGRASSSYGSHGDNATDLDKWPASRTST